MFDLLLGDVVPDSESARAKKSAFAMAHVGIRMVFKLYRATEIEMLEGSNPKWAITTAEAPSIPDSCLGGCIRGTAWHSCRQGCSSVFWFARE